MVFCPRLCLICGIRLYFISVNSGTLAIVVLFHRLGCYLDSKAHLKIHTICHIYNIRNLLQP